MIRLAAASMHINAPQERVFELFTTAEGLCSWMANEAEVDLRPGGSWRWVHDDGATSSGTYLEIEPHNRLTFTYGWESGPYAEMPPGSTNVEVRFEAEGETTRVTIRHTAVPTDFSDAHAAGWTYFLDVLRNVVAGKPIATVRLPASPDANPAGGD